MVLRSPCGTPLANSAGSTLIHTPTPSSILMGVAAQRSSRSPAMASRMSITGGLSKTLKCKSFIQSTFFPVCLFVLLLLLTAVSVSSISFQWRTFSWFPAKTRTQWWRHSDCSWSDWQSFKQVKRYHCFCLLWASTFFLILQVVNDSHCRTCVS